MQEYRTKQKELLLKCLEENKDVHLTAADILTHLRDTGHSLGASTVYRQLDKLVASGVVRKFIIDETSSACYQYSGTAGECCEHFHLKCNVCGKLIHTDCSLMKEITEHMQKSHGFYVDSTKTLLYGVCRECMESQSDE